MPPAGSVLTTSPGCRPAAARGRRRPRSAGRRCAGRAARNRGAPSGVSATWVRTIGKTQRYSACKCMWSLHLNRPYGFQVPLADRSTTVLQPKHVSRASVGRECNLVPPLRGYHSVWAAMSSSTLRAVLRCACACRARSAARSWLSARSARALGDLQLPPHAGIVRQFALVSPNLDSHGRRDTGPAAAEP